jgi:hydroxymethylbilane synthase
MEREKIIVGTRGSALALVQAELTENLLRAAFPHIEIDRKVIKTTGDRRIDVALKDVAKSEGVLDKGVFTKELEIALATKEIDVAVHSLKDVPTVIDTQFIITAVLKRAPIRDVLITKTPNGIKGLPQAASVGTSSVRRARQLEWMRPDLRLLDLRGNVPTRLKKISESKKYDAIVLAEAGLIRLGLLNAENNELYYEVLDERSFYPAAGQGAIGLEVRSDDAWLIDCLKSINHDQTLACILAEREFLRLLDGGCSTPVGVFTKIEKDELHMFARVFPEEGGEPRISTVIGYVNEPLKCALKLFSELK